MGSFIVVFEKFRTWVYVAVLMNGIWHSVGIDFKCVNSRTKWINFKFSRLKV